MVQISGFVFILDATSWPVETPMVAKITPRHIFKPFLPMQFRSVQCQMSKEFTRLRRQDIYQYLICPEMQDALKSSKMKLLPLFFCPLRPSKLALLS